VKPYAPVPYSDFSQEQPRASYQSAIAAATQLLPGRAPLIIGGVTRDTAETIRSVNPASPDKLVAEASSATVADASDALDAAWQAFPGWAGTPAAERAAIVHRIGDIMEERIHEFSAWMTLEAGKNYAESEADTAEAIDFCRYYAHQALAMDEPVDLYSYPGETNESFLRPLGAGVVIPPWNFPLAILCGMAVGPVAAGNTVVLKPASNTPMIGAMFMDAVQAAGVPPGVINFLPGSGGTIGDALVDDPRTRFINFTGSKEVGLRIAERSAVVHPGQKWLKRSYMEMGGKDALIIDATADLDAAAADAVRSAYGFQGQKCSACSRLILVDDIYEEVLDKVLGLTAQLTMGDPADNHAVGPVISAAQFRAIQSEVEGGRAEAALVTGGGTVDIDGGYYIEPTVFADVSPNSRLAQHEIFGPVLSVIKAADFTDALQIANGTEFGLTGGLHSTSEENIARARREFHVGNLYINRKITGALVGIQPFGGFNMSGSNAKAGGPDYLRLFMEMKSVTRRL
jgi:1-pyrroline-5-carboxylate dehydrogenase